MYAITTFVFSYSPTGERIACPTHYARQRSRHYRVVSTPSVTEQHRRDRNENKINGTVDSTPRSRARGKQKPTRKLSAVRKCCAIRRPVYGPRGKITKKGFFFTASVRRARCCSRDLLKTFGTFATRCSVRLKASSMGAATRTAGRSRLSIKSV